MAKPIQMTQEGYDKLQKELELLKGPERTRIAEAIREAKSHGDLRENAAYHEAKLNQARLEGRIAELERSLQSARIVERPDDAGESIHLGSVVTLYDEEFDEELTVTIVGEMEADPAKDYVSIGSPMGQALLGCHAGDTAEYEAPMGTVRLRILKVEH